MKINAHVLRLTAHEVQIHLLRSNPHRFWLHQCIRGSSMLAVCPVSIRCNFVLCLVNLDRLTLNSLCSGRKIEMPMQCNEHVTCNLMYYQREQPATSQFPCAHVIIVIDANRSRWPIRFLASSRIQLIRLALHPKLFIKQIIILILNTLLKSNLYLSLMQISVVQAHNGFRAKLHILRIVIFALNKVIIISLISKMLITLIRLPCFSCISTFSLPEKNHLKYESFVLLYITQRRM